MILTGGRKRGIRVVVVSLHRNRKIPIWPNPLVRHPEVRKRVRVFSSGRVGLRDLVLKTREHKVSPAYSHDEECACSLTAVEMTYERRMIRLISGFRV